MKLDVIRVGAALTVLAMILEAIAPNYFYFLPFGGGPLEQFAVFIGGAFVVKELRNSFTGRT